jgi:N-acetylglucosamine-6-phosphate deacetylase
MFLSDGAIATSRAYVNNEWVDGGIKVIDSKLNSYGEVAGQSGMAIPGYVDLQVNGHGGVDLLAAKSTEEIRKLSRSLYANSVIAYLPTLITGPKEQSLHALNLIEEVRKNPLPGEAQIIGTHLEGPFISPVKSGMHPVEYIKTPDQTLIGEFLRAGKISQVTIAPELPGAIELIKFLTASGVVVSLGHSNATASQAHAGFDAGAKTVTHLWNAMKKRTESEPGLAQVALERDDVIIQLIIDEVHLDSELVIDSLKQCPGRFIVTNDAVSAAGVGEGVFAFGEIEIKVENGRATRMDGTLAGGVGTLDKSLKLMWEYGVGLEDAIDSVTSRPADLMDMGQLGRLDLGSPVQILTL